MTPNSLEKVKVGYIALNAESFTLLSQVLTSTMKELKLQLKVRTFCSYNIDFKESYRSVFHNDCGYACRFQIVFTSCQTSHAFGASL